MDDLTNYCKLIHDVCENTAMNYAKHLKSVIKRIVSKGWMLNDLFDNYKCSNWQGRKHDIKSMVGHAKITSTDHYLRGNKSRVSETMQKLKQKLFDVDGKLIDNTATFDSGKILPEHYCKLKNRLYFVLMRSNVVGRNR